MACSAEVPRKKVTASLTFASKYLTTVQSRTCADVSTWPETFSRGRASFTMSLLKLGRRKELMKRLSLALILISLLTVTMLAAVNDTSALHPPKGAKVAIIVFEDLQCPDCARAEPLLQEAAKTYKIPIVRHDFPLAMHNWSFEAHVMARYFDTKSKALGEEFREFLFKNQPSITK